MMTQQLEPQAEVERDTEAAVEGKMEMPWLSKGEDGGLADEQSAPVASHTASRCPTGLLRANDCDPPGAMLLTTAELKVRAGMQTGTEDWEVVPCAPFRFSSGVTLQAVRPEGLELLG